MSGTSFVSTIQEIQVSESFRGLSSLSPRLRLIEGLLIIHVKLMLNFFSLSSSDTDLVRKDLTLPVCCSTIVVAAGLLTDLIGTLYFRPQSDCDGRERWAPSSEQLKM